MHKRWALLIVIAIAYSSPAENLKTVQPKAAAEGFLLIAHERMIDPRFRESVLLMTQYGSDGAMGVIINRPTDIPLSTALPQVEELAGSRAPLFFGGPVSRRVVSVLFQSDDEPQAEGITRVFANVYFSRRQEIIDEVFSRSKPVFKVYSGFAGWAPGQLEREIDRGDWLLGKAAGAIIFKKESTHIWPDLTGHPRPNPGNTIQARTD